MSIPSVLLRLAVLGGLLAAGAAQAQPAAALTAINAIAPGMWELRVEGEAPRSICVARPDAFVQVRHRDSACSRIVIANEKSSATVHYSCPGAGWGRTTVRVSTPNLVHIDTQGIADNAPFAFTADAHRAGDCGGNIASR